MFSDHFGCFGDDQIRTIVKRLPHESQTTFIERRCAQPAQLFHTFFDSCHRACILCGQEEIMRQAICIGVVGDYDSESNSHPATTQAIYRAADSLGIRVTVEWVSTHTIDPRAPEKALKQYDGIWAGPGSPYRSFDGMLAAIRYARERGVPFNGT
jgi:CTP synthase (UTP-ammonia lyase)